MAFTYKRIITYFFRGLLFVVPIALTIYVIYLIIQFLDGILPIPIPGLGILIMLAFITFIGFLASIFITKPLFDVFEKWVFKKEKYETFIFSKRNWWSTWTVRPASALRAA